MSADTLLVTLMNGLSIRFIIRLGCKKTRMADTKYLDRDDYLPGKKEKTYRLSGLYIYFLHFFVESD